MREHRRATGRLARGRSPQRRSTESGIKRRRPRPDGAMARELARRRELRARGGAAATVARPRSCIGIDDRPATARRARGGHRGWFADRAGQRILRLRISDGAGEGDRRPRDHIAEARAAAARQRAGQIFSGVWRRAEGSIAAWVSRVSRRPARASLSHFPALQLLVRHRLFQSLHASRRAARNRCFRRATGAQARRHNGFVPVR